MKKVYIAPESTVIGVTEECELLCGMSVNVYDTDGKLDYRDEVIEGNLGDGDEIGAKGDAWGDNDDLWGGDY